MHPNHKVKGNKTRVFKLKSIKYVDKLEFLTKSAIVFHFIFLNLDRAIFYSYTIK